MKRKRIMGSDQFELGKRRLIGHVILGVDLEPGYARARGQEL